VGVGKIHRWLWTENIEVYKPTQFLDTWRKKRNTIFVYTFWIL